MIIVLSSMRLAFKVCGKWDFKHSMLNKLISMKPSPRIQAVYGLWYFDGSIMDPSEYQSPYDGSIMDPAEYQSPYTAWILGLNETV